MRYLMALAWTVVLAAALAGCAQDCQTIERHTNETVQQTETRIVVE